MWISLPFIMLLLVLIIHRALARKGNSPSQVFCFLCAGTPVGILTIILSFLAFGYTEKALVSILIYAASCEFILHIFSLAANGVSVSVLDQFSKGSTDLHTLEFEYSTYSMVTRRIKRLELDGLLIKKLGKFQLTSKGQVLVRSFLRLRRFFGHEPLLMHLKITKNLNKEAVEEVKDSA